MQGVHIGYYYHHEYSIENNVGPQSYTYVCLVSSCRHTASVNILKVIDAVTKGAIHCCIQFDRWHFARAVDIYLTIIYYVFIIYLLTD